MMKMLAAGLYPMTLRKTPFIVIALVIFFVQHAASCCTLEMQTPKTDTATQEELQTETDNNSQDEAPEEDKGFKLDTPSLVVIGLFSAAFLGIICWLLMISSKQSSQENLKSQEFEYELLGSAAQMAKKAARDKAGAGKTPAEVLLERLQVVNLVKMQEGIVTFGEGKERQEALLVTLKDGRRAMLFNSLTPAGELQRQLSRADLAIVPGKGEEAMVITSFGDFIANQFRL